MAVFIHCIWSNGTILYFNQKPEDTHVESLKTVFHEAMIKAINK